ncbi:hypothetical protein D0C27_18760 [Alcaligenes faecalis]|nr:hypothetical protein D0C27_18760 [Alcaligenes faecalis]
MKTNKPKAVGRSLADLKKLQGQVRQDLNPPPAPRRRRRRWWWWWLRVAGSAGSRTRLFIMAFEGSSKRET